MKVDSVNQYLMDDPSITDSRGIVNNFDYKIFIHVDATSIVESYDETKNNKLYDFDGKKCTHAPSVTMSISSLLDNVDSVIIKNDLGKRLLTKFINGDSELNSCQVQNFNHLLRAINVRFEVRTDERGYMGSNIMTLLKRGIFDEIRLKKTANSDRFQIEAVYPDSKEYSDYNNISTRYFYLFVLLCTIEIGLLFALLSVNHSDAKLILQILMICIVGLMTMTAYMMISTHTGVFQYKVLFRKLWLFSWSFMVPCIALIFIVLYQYGIRTNVIIYGMYVSIGVSAMMTSIALLFNYLAMEQNPLNNTRAFTTNCQIENDLSATLYDNTRNRSKILSYLYTALGLFSDNCCSIRINPV